MTSKHSPPLDSEALLIARALLSTESTTPAQRDVFEIVAAELEGIGAAAEYFVLPYDDKGTRWACNALFGFDKPKGNLLCFAGHLDTVPPSKGGFFEPFEPAIFDRSLFARGAVDMKSSVACFIAALKQAHRDGHDVSRVCLLLSGDEESNSHNSMEKIVKILQERGVSFDLCLVGEPTSEKALGDTIKVGRRGSCSFTLTIKGRSGHVAYPKLATNPLNRLGDVINALRNCVLDEGSEFFQPSHLAITDVASSNPSHNVTPDHVDVKFNVRFNDKHTVKSLASLISNALLPHLGGNHTLAWKAGALPFLSEPSPYTELVAEAVRSVTGRSPVLSTSGGTSDARYLYKLGPTVELGPLNSTAHTADECIPLQDIADLASIYYEIIVQFCNR